MNRSEDGDMEARKDKIKKSNRDKINGKIGAYRQFMTPAGYFDEYRLRGAIYGGGYYFTSRIVDKLGQVWYADRLTNGNRCIFEQTVTTGIRTG